MHRTEIPGVSGWGLVAPLLAEMPEDLIKTYEKCESPIEQLFAAALGAVIMTICPHAQPKIDTQVRIGKYRADIVITARDGGQNWVVECDGAEYHTDKEKDDKRTAEIEKHGYRVYRVTGSEIHHNPVALAKEVLLLTGFLPMTLRELEKLMAKNISKNGTELLLAQC